MDRELVKARLQMAKDNVRGVQDNLLKNDPDASDDFRDSLLDAIGAIQAAIEDIVSLDDPENGD